MKTWTKWDKLKVIGMFLNGAGIFIQAILRLIKHREEKKVNRMIRDDLRDRTSFDIPEEDYCFGNR